MAANIPEKVGRYQLKEVVGRGGMGVVYKAHDPNLAIDVAIKVLRPDMADKKRFIQRFFQEAKVIARLTHPNIIQIYNIDEADGQFFIAMRFIQGKPLHKYIRETGPDLNKIIDIIVQIADALDYAHKNKVIHRDIKPSNILITDEGQVFLTDFGVAHLGDSAIGLKTVAGARMGTPLYMSPEQLDGLKTDGRSDLFSLGIVLYEMVTGKPPYPPYSRTTKPVPPIEINATLSKSFSRLIMKSLHINPEKRFQTGREMAEALKAFNVDEKDTLVIEEQAEEKPVSQVSHAWNNGDEALPPTQMRQPSRTKAFMPILISVILLGGAIMAISYYRPWQSRKPVTESDIVIKGTLNIDSIPPGAAVVIDGGIPGNASGRFDLPIGTHEVRLSLDHYFDGNVTVKVDKGEMTLHYRLLSMDRTEW